MVRRALPHGHVAAVLGTLRDIGLDRRSGLWHRCRALVIALIVARLLAPASKLAAPAARPLTAAFSLGEPLGLARLPRRLSVALAGWASARGGREGARAQHRAPARWCSATCRRAIWRAAARLAQRGYTATARAAADRLRPAGAGDGCPVAIEAFEGVRDPRTLAAQIDKVKKRFALDHVVLVGDRG